MDIAFYKELKKECSTNQVSLVAVSKTKSCESIAALYDLGQRIFAENKVQELVSKNKILPLDIQWHFIGHLQKNKVKYIAPFIALIHAVDSIGLLYEIDKRALQNKRKIECLLQFHIAKEDQKFGFHINQIEELITQLPLYKNIVIKGVMGMASFTADTNVIRTEFQQLKKIFDGLKQTYFKDQKNFSVLSMGMSGDYKIAVEEGSNMLRIGSSIFGSRQKP